MRNWISLAVLFVAVAALGTWVYYRPQAPAMQSHALSELEPKDVERIRIERAGSSASDETAAAPGAAAAILVTRKADAWHLAEPFSARAEFSQVERLLNILSVHAPTRYAATELARYGLEGTPPKLTLNDQSFSFGAVNTMTREQYVLTRDHVYPIALAHRTALPRDANALVARSLFAPGEEPVHFELPGFTATLENGRWVIAPQTEDAGADARNAWVDGWRRASALQASQQSGSAAKENVTIRLKDGRTLALGILAREPELVLLRTDEGIEYHFIAAAAKRMLSPPQEKK
jgi:hypothetical protein